MTFILGFVTCLVIDLATVVVFRKRIIQVLEVLDRDLSRGH